MERSEIPPERGTIKGNSAVQKGTRQQETILLMTEQNKKALAKWLIFALVAIYFQVILGGITRLTESGLSMTDWKVVMGTIPPVGEQAWQLEFDKYQQSPEYKELNKGMTLSEFKSIFFWEWLHRIWGRFGFMLILGIFLFFLWRKKLDKEAVYLFGVLLVLYALQGVLGWFMVMSGLVDRPEVSHYRLTAHLLAALFLFAYILWWVCKLLVSEKGFIVHPKLSRFATWLIVLVLIQIAYGGFMSGLKAAGHFPTWPDMNGYLFHPTLFGASPFWRNFTEHIPTIQFIHRTLAYCILIFGIIFWIKSNVVTKEYKMFHKSRHAFLIVLCVQVLLGITVLLTTKGQVVVFWGVVHQACGLLLISVLLFNRFHLKKQA